MNNTKPFKVGEDNNLLTNAIRSGSLQAYDTSFKHNRDKFMNASEAGTCIRRQFFQKKHPELADAQSWGYAHRGSNIESHVLKCLAGADPSYDMILTHTGESQISLVDEETGIAGTPDGFVSTTKYSKEGEPPKMFVLEIKSIDPMVKVDNLPRKAHLDQLQINIALAQKLGVEGANYDIAGGVIVYVNASNYDIIHEYLVEPPTQEFMDEMIARAKLILSSRTEKHLNREGQMQTNSECRYCPFTKHCGVDISQSATAPKKAAKGTDLETAVMQMAGIKESKASLSDEEKRLKQTIIDELTKRKTREMQVNGYIVKLTHSDGRMTLDKDLLKAKLGDLKEFEKQGSSFETLTITPM